MRTDDELRTLAARAQTGNLDAAEDLFRGVCGHLIAFLYLLGLNDSEIDDAAQEVCLRIYRYLRKYDPDEPFLPWMRTVARNWARNYWRDRKRAGQRADAFREYVHCAFDAAEAEHAPDPAKDLRHCVDQLSEPHQRLVKMRYQKRLTSAQIGECLDRSAVSVRKTLSRVYQALRDCLEQRGIRDVG